MNKALLAFLYSVPVILAAQAPAVALGTRIRIEMHDKSRIEGTLMAQSADSLAVSSPRAVRTSISSEYIARVRRGEGKSHGQGAVNGLKIGAGIVGGVTTILVAGWALSNGEGLEMVPVGAVAGAITGAFYGVILGGIVGAEKWTNLYTTPQRVSLVPAPGTAPGIGIRVGF